MALSNEAIQGLLAFGMGTLANNTGNYGMFGPAVGKGGLLGLQQYGNAQQNSLLARRQGEDEKYRKFQMDDTAAQRELQRKQMEQQAENQRLIAEQLSHLFGPQPTAPQVMPQATAPFSQDSIRASLAMGGGPTKEAENVLLQSGIREQPDITAPSIDPAGQNWPDPQTLVQSALRMAQLDPSIAQTLLSGANFYQGAQKEEVAAQERQANADRGKLTPVTGLPGIFVDNDYDKHFARVRNKDGMLDWQELTTDEVAAMDLRGRKAAATNVSQTNVAGNKYSENLGKGFADKDLKDFEAAGIAAENVKKLRGVIKHIESSDAITGVGADLLKNVDRAKTLFTNSEKSGKRVSDTEMLDAFLGSDVFPMISALGIGARGLDTPAEREFLRQVMTGTINMNKTTLAEMAKLRKNIAERAVAKWNKRVKMLPLDAIEGAGYTRESMMISLDEDPEEERANIRRYNPATGKIE